MKSKSLILVFIANLIAAYSQINWQGDTLSFVISDSSVALNSESVSSSKLIYFESDAYEDAVWEIQTTMEFNPSSSNYCRFYFASNNKNLSSGTSYYVECGSSDDDIKLFKCVKEQNTLLIDGKDGRLNNSSNLFTIKVTRQKNGTMNLYYKNDVSDNYEHEGSCLDTELKYSKYFQLFCNYTSTRSDKMSFKIIELSGSAPIDSIPPALESAYVYNSRTVKLFFNEAVNVQKKNILPPKNNTVASITSNSGSVEILFSEPVSDCLNLIINDISDASGNSYLFDSVLCYTVPEVRNFRITTPYTIQFEASHVIDLDYANRIFLNNSPVDKISAENKVYLIEFWDSIPPDVPINLTIERLLFENNDTLQDFNTTLSYHIPAIFDVVINEIMANPIPTLSYSEEYIELFNRSNYSINLKDWKLIINEKATDLPEYLLMSQEYVCLSRNSFEADNLIVLNSLAYLNNTSFKANLITNNNIISDELNYNFNMHVEPFKKQGGWSLERIDPENLQSNYNWASCIQSDGGTPGVTNSVNAINTDTTAAKIVNAYFSSPNQLTILTDEPIKTCKISNTTNPNPLEFTYGGIRNKIIADMPEPIKDTVVYYINAAFEDYNANYYQTTFPVSKMYEPEVGDIVINEIMYDPDADTHEFIEIYNNSNKCIDLRKTFLSKRNSDGLIEPLSRITENPVGFLSHAYLIVSPQQILAQYYPERNIVVKNFNTLKNDGDNVLICTQSGSIIDEVNYSPSWHSGLLKNTKGISLEKIHPSLDNNSSESWTSGLAGNLRSSPACINNNYFNIYSSVDLGIIKLSSEFISPDYDGTDDILKITIKCENESLITIKAFNYRGEIVKSIANNYPCIGELLFTWDGTHKSGSLSIGINMLVIEITQNGSTTIKRYPVSVLQ